MYLIAPSASLPKGRTITFIDMSDISIQFYALPSELIALVNEWKKHYELHGVVMKAPAKKGLDRFAIFDELDESGIDEDDIRSVFLSKDIPSEGAKNRYEFIMANSDALAIDIGHLTPFGLEQSWLSARTENVDVLPIWRKLAASLKKNTFAGTWAQNVETGGKAFYKNIRYSPVAEALSRNGTKLLTDGPNVICSIDEPSST